MALASAELAKNLRALAARFDQVPKPPKELMALSFRARRLAATFDRLELAAKSDRIIGAAELRTLGRAFNDAAIQITEAVELLDFVASSVAVQGLGERIARIGNLTGHALELARLRLS